MNVYQNNSSKLTDFLIISELGKGAFSNVYKVRRLADSQEYALKKVKMDFLNHKEKQNALNEVRLLASINNKHIVAYKEAFFDDDAKCLCIVMELMEGGDVFRKITQAQRGGPQITESEIWKALIHMTLGLKVLHDQKIVHRDLKSANVFLTLDGVFKLGDLNVSKVAKQGFVLTQTGTPYYASPEVWKNLPYDYKSDIWSLGCLIYEMCCLFTPFRARSMDQLYQKVQKGQYDPLPPKYPKELSQLIANFLKQQPEQRPNCNDILSNPTIQKKLREFETSISQIQANQTIELLQTIKIPQTIDQLKRQFPKPKYEIETSSTKNKSTEHSNSPFQSPQQITKTLQDSRQSLSNGRQVKDVTQSVAYMDKKKKHPLLVYGPQGQSTASNDRIESASQQRKLTLQNQFESSNQNAKEQQSQQKESQQINRSKVSAKLTQDKVDRENFTQKPIYHKQSTRAESLDQERLKQYVNHFLQIQKDQHDKQSQQKQNLNISQTTCNVQENQMISIPTTQTNILKIKKPFDGKEKHINVQEIKKQNDSSAKKKSQPNSERPQVFPTQAKVIKVKTNEHQSDNKDSSTRKPRPQSITEVALPLYYESRYQPKNNQLDSKYDHFYPIKNYEVTATAKEGNSKQKLKMRKDYSLEDYIKLKTETSSRS